jgi:uncharacterized protein with ATP-grasp and redox domains
MAVRVPAIVDQVLARNADYPAEVRAELAALSAALRQDAPLPASHVKGPDPRAWSQALAERRGESWLATDWFFAETYLYRRVIDAVELWSTERDPFRPHKREEYAGVAHAQALAGALDIALGSAAGAARADPRERTQRLLLAAVFGNRADLSFSTSSGDWRAQAGDLLLDDSEATAHLLHETTGMLHIVADNAGTELSVDLVLCDYCLHVLGADVVLHVKQHPTFVSDATRADVLWFLEHAAWQAWGGVAQACRERLLAALASRRLQIAPHPFWNGPLSLWELPPDLEQQFFGARLVVLKGDANYRRALGDAIWPADTPFAHATAYFPAPLLSLRTLKSDPIVGLSLERAALLDQTSPKWRVDGQRGIASLGGRLAAG